LTSKTNPRPTVDLGYPTEQHGRIPAFNSIEEEAEFWDTHDFTDFLEETEPFELTVGPELRRSVTVRFETDDREELDRRAEELGVEPAELVRMWVEERLKKKHRRRILLPWVPTRKRSDRR
jgi:hypothetical protein